MHDLAALASVVHSRDNLGAPISSGSFRHDGMIVAPCSVKAMSEIATGVTSSLMTRAADVTLKERRPLVLMVLSPVPSLREERPRPGRERNIELGFRRKSNRRSRERRRGESSCEVFFFEKKSSKPAAFSTSSTSTRHFLLCSLFWRPINYFSSCSSVM